MAEERRITAIETGRRGRRVIYVDGEEGLDLPRELVEKLSLRVGQSLLPEAQEEIRQSAAVQDAKVAAVQALGRRARTRADLRRRLLGKGLPEAAVAEALQWLADRKYLDDEQYAEQRWSALEQRKLGAEGIAWKLVAEGVPREVAERLQAERAEELNETERVREIAAQRNASLRNVPWPQRRSRLYSYLARRGFSSEAIAEALTRLELESDA